MEVTSLIAICLCLLSFLTSVVYLSFQAGVIAERKKWDALVRSGAITRPRNHLGEIIIK